MPVYYPRLIVGRLDLLLEPDQCCPLEPPVPAPIRAPTAARPRGHPHAAYRMTLVLNPVLGQYYGVQGTTWQHPPLLASPPETKVGERQALQHLRAGRQADRRGLADPRGVYWISNTLTSDIPNGEMSPSRPR